MSELTLGELSAFRKAVPPLVGQALLWIFGSISTVIAVAVVVFSNGNPFAIAGLLGALVVAVVTIYRVDWGLYLFVLMVFLFDQFAIPGVPSLTYSVGYFLNINAITYLPTVRAAVVNPMEVQLLGLFLVWLLAGFGSGKLSLVRIPLKIPFLLFFAAVVGSLVHGWAGGGDAIASLWETRAFFYLGIMYFFVPQIIQTKDQVQTLMWFCIAGISFKALQGSIRFASMGFSFGWWPNIVQARATTRNCCGRR